MSDRGSTKEKSPSHPSTYTGTLNQSNAVSCHFGFPFPGRVNFRLRAIFLIFTLIIGKEDLAVGILGLNGKEDWPWDPTDEMNFQWKQRSRIRSVGAGELRGKEREIEKKEASFSLTGATIRYPSVFFLAAARLSPSCLIAVAGASFGNCCETWGDRRTRPM